MTRQGQSVGDGATAYQAGTSITVNNAMSPDQMADIIIAITSKVAEYFEDARSKFNDRCDELRKEIIEEFAKPGSTANTEAFKDPDFQYALQNAHHAYGRIGGEELRDELVRLLGERSKYPAASRIAHVLNEALRVSASLTKEEYAALALCFIVKYVRIGVGSLADLNREFSKILGYFADDIPTDDASYDYLASLGCITISIGQTDLWSALYQHYGAIATDGYPKVAVDEIIGRSIKEGRSEPIESILSLMRKVPDRFDGRIMFSPYNIEALRESLSSVGCSRATAEMLVRLHSESLIDVDTFKSRFLKNVPHADRFVGAWHATNLKSVSLTALGKALAHSVVSSQLDFNAPLEIWVK